VTYLLDTDWLVDIIGGRPRATRTINELNPDHLYISIVSHGELFEGVFGYADTGARLDEMNVFLSRYETLPLTNPIMEIFGRTRSELRRAGRLIADLDLLIGATAVAHDFILLTRNTRHFARIPDLRLYESE
jgi:predicted nucleic acid-binding protein